MWRNPLLCAAVLAVAPVLNAAESSPPVSTINPVTGAIETVDDPWLAQNFEVRHVINRGEGLPLLVKNVSENPADDLAPRLAVDSITGDTMVVWWRADAVPSVLCRRRLQETGAWGPVLVQSDPSVPSRRPSVAFDGSRMWVAYEHESNGAISVSVQIIDDEPTPFIHAQTVATSITSGTAGPEVLSDSGHLWVSWIHDATLVGWIEYDFATENWSNPSFEPFSSDSVAEARSRIRSTVLSD